MTPNSLKLKTSVQGITARNILDNAEKKFLQVRLQQTESTWQKMNETLNEIDEKLCMELSPELCSRTRTLFTHAHKRSFEECKQRQHVKFDALVENKRGSNREGGDVTTKIDTSQ